jgi:hypothetical protein
MHNLLLLIFKQLQVLRTAPALQDVRRLHNICLGNGLEACVARNHSFQSAQP